MSLINDALKQAGEHQKKNPPAPAPVQFRAPEEPARRNYTPPAVLLGALLVALALGGVLVGVALQKRSDSLLVNARTSNLPPTPETTVPLDTPSITPAPHPELPVVAAAPPVTSLPETNLVAAPAEPPRLGRLKLQGISYNRSRPSAVVSGKTLYPGDRFGEFRVAKITADSVTLTSGTGETQVLSLSQ